MAVGFPLPVEPNDRVFGSLCSGIPVCSGPCVRGSNLPSLAHTARLARRPDPLLRALQTSRSTPSSWASSARH
eukprot:5677945-Prymnesium_polylepis.1